MAQATVAPVKPIYKCVFERTVMRQAGKKTVTAIDHFEDPEAPEFKALVEAGERGHLSVSTVDGEDVVGMATSATNAQSIMRGCAKGTYNPFPKIKKKMQDMESPRAVAGL